MRIELRLPLEPPRSEDRDSDDVDGTDNGDGIRTSHNEIPDEEVYHPNTMTPSVQRTYELRPRKPRDYSNMYAHATLVHHAMMQDSLKEGLRKFQKVVEEAVSKELKQFHVRDTLAPQDSSELRDAQK
jgi:hypothetical protein